VQSLTRLTVCYREWKNDIEVLHRLASRNFAKRLFRNHEDAKAISDRIQAITWRIQNLTVCLILFISPSIEFHIGVKQVESVLAVEFTLDVSRL
jgi:hypothetical protein